MISEINKLNFIFYQEGNQIFKNFSFDIHGESTYYRYINLLAKNLTKKYNFFFLYKFI